MNDASLPEKAIKKARNLIRDSQLAVVVGLIPVLGLVYILRLVQWYLLRSQFPLLRTDASEIGAQFRTAIYRLWFAVLFWPVVILGFGIGIPLYFSYF